MRGHTVLDAAPATPTEEPRGGRFAFSRWHLVLLPIALVMIVPLVWMVVTSLQTLDETRHYPPALAPTSLQFQNYTQVLQVAPFTRWFMNTLIVTVVCVIANLLFCSLAGYAFARIKFFGREVVFLLILATLMIPFQVVIIPTFLIVK
jgi:multiple sugar transport system permease protein